jgi:hypothetical protein
MVGSEWAVLGSRGCDCDCDCECVLGWLPWQQCWLARFAAITRHLIVIIHSFNIIINNHLSLLSSHYYCCSTHTHSL